MTQKRGFIVPLVSFIVVLAIVIFGGWHYMNKDKVRLSTVPAIPSAGTSSDAVDGFKTYSNTDFGFSFKYPADLKILVTPGTSTFETIDVRLSNFDFVQGDQNKKLPSNDAFYVYITGIKKEHNPHFAEVKKTFEKNVSNFTLSGVPASRTMVKIGDSLGEGKGIATIEDSHTVIWAFTSDTDYRIGVRPYSKTDVLDSIVSTFIITKK